LIDGIPHAMSPLPVPKHQRIAMSLGTEFSISLKKCSSCRAYQPIDYKVEEDTIIQPGMLVVSGEINKKFLDFAPLLVVEILAPSTALKDRHTKFSNYESQKIKYYLIVSPDTEEVEVYELKNDNYELQQNGRSFKYDFSFVDDCSASIDFDEIRK
jgi:Uma2 family endonuclease